LWRYAERCVSNKDWVMKKTDRSRKAQEAHAEQLLKLSTSLMTAFLVVILIVPISTIVAASFNNIPTINPIDFYSKLFGSWYAIVFILAEIGLYYVVVKTKEKALSVYDELYPDEESET
jgi:NADH:ubiquinone oxidoreductase subunit 6 (subunit J)